MFLGKMAPILGANRASNPLLIPDALHAWVGGYWATVDGGGGVTNVTSITNLIQPAYPLAPVVSSVDIRTTSIGPSGFAAWSNNNNFVISSVLPTVTLTQGTILFVGFGNIANGGNILSLATTPNGYSLALEIYNGAGGIHDRISINGSYSLDAGPIAAAIELWTWDLSLASGSRKIRCYTYDSTNGSQTFQTNTSTASAPLLQRAYVGAISGIGVTTGVITATLQVSDKFVADADAAALMTTLRSAYGY